MKNVIFSRFHEHIFRSSRSQMFFKTHFFCKNKLYKNSEAEIGQKIKKNLEHFEAGKCKDK